MIPGLHPCKKILRAPIGLPIFSYFGTANINVVGLLLKRIT